MPNRDPSDASFESQESLCILGTTILQYRQQRGLSLRAFATLTGLSHIYLSQIEKGQRNVTILSLLRIAGALHIPLYTLIAPLDQHVASDAPPTI
ncbi:MAG TPA: helix-turn-helix domain-containing protein [Candidatus Tectomicrobia bacterium]